MTPIPDNPLLRMVQEAEAAKMKEAGKEFHLTQGSFKQALNGIAEDGFESLLEFKRRTGLKESDQIEKKGIAIDDIVGTEADHKWGNIKPRGDFEASWQYFYGLAEKIVGEKTEKMPPIQVTGRGDKYWVSEDGRHRVLVMKVLRRMNWPVLNTPCELNPLEH
jgi:hypothetical protein